MKKSYFPLVMFTALSWILCAIDGVCVILKEPFLGVAGGHCMSAFFFALLGGLLWFGWKHKSPKIWKVLFVWSCVALGSMLVVVFGLWGLMALGVGSTAVTVAGVIVSILSTPVSSGSIMFLPIFGWACVLMISLMLYRRRSV